jgi:phosphoglycolate phosphatase
VAAAQKERQLAPVTDTIDGRVGRRQWGSGVAAAAVKAVLFDLDGTLLDTAPDMAAALNSMRAADGLPALPFGKVRELVSHGARALVRFGYPQAPDSELEPLRARFISVYAEQLVVETRPFAGISAAIARLEAANRRWGIVTNKPAALTVPLLERVRLAGKPGVVVCGDTLLQRKPHPAQLLHAAALLGVAPGECIYIGDAQRDVLAARAANMAVFVALYGYIPAQEQPRSWPAQGWLETPQALAQLLDTLIVTD